MLYLAVEGYTWRLDVGETNALYDKMSEEKEELGGLTSLEERAYNHLVDAKPINCRKKVTPDDSIGEARRDGLEVHEIVAELQYVLCAQGWCMLCIDLISRTRLQVKGSAFPITLPLSFAHGQTFRTGAQTFLGTSGCICQPFVYSLSGCSRGVQATLPFCIANAFCMALMYGRMGVTGA
jgi:hypothetical protein